MRHPFPGRVEMTIQVLLDDRFELIQQIRLKVAHCRSVTYASVGYATVGTGTQRRSVTRPAQTSRTRRRRGRATATVIQWRSRADQAPLSMAPARRPSTAVSGAGARAASPMSVTQALRLPAHYQWRWRADQAPLSVP